jgi:FkbM family methyltransferase
VGKRASFWGLAGQVRDLARILRDEPRATRKETLQSYARILRRVGAEKSGRGTCRELRIFDLNVCYLNADSLRHMAREIYVDRHYEFTSTRAQPTIVDAGANIGLATLFFKQKHPNARVIAFEPEPHAYATLERNIAANHLECVTTVPKALAGESGARDLFVERGSLVSSLLTARGTSSERRTVETVPLSTYIGDHLDFLKLDVEGMENDIIDELSTAGKLGVIERLVCEYHHHIENVDDRLSHALQTLEECGFGYQLHAGLRGPFQEAVFQDILIFAYNKKWFPRP